MPKKSYEELLEHLNRTDLLAIERTQLANKRTLLAYIRTAFSLLIASLGIIEFFENRLFIYLSFVLIPVSFIFLIIGIVRFTQSYRTIEKIIGNFDKETDDDKK